jgi:hypothetical protein
MGSVEQQMKDRGASPNDPFSTPLSGRGAKPQLEGVPRQNKRYPVDGVEEWSGGESWLGMVEPDGWIWTRKCPRS